MTDTGDTTATGKRGQARSKSVVAYWKLRALYAGAVGIVQEAAKGWDGQGPFLIGRRTSSLRLGPALLLDDERVSREHARLIADGSHVLLQDAGSKNGTEVNGRRLAIRESCTVGDGDLIRVGDSLVLLRYEQALTDDVAIPSLIGVSLALCKLRTAVKSYANDDRPVLLLGETGTGKGVVAQALHDRSGRAGKFVAVNCAALPATLAESLLFGVQQGAFTGAAEQLGHFREADEGTLFLDEIGELPPEVQPKLLHALEARQVRPLGSSRPVPCNVRVIAATNRDLDDARQSGRFRRDLYSRLATLVLTLPPLRERREDTLLLAKHLAGEDFRPTADFAAALLQYPFPDNVREVGNVVHQLRHDGEETVRAWLEAQSVASQSPIAEAPSLPLAAPSAVSTPTQPRWQPGDPPPTRRDLVDLLERYRGKLLSIEREHGYSRSQLRRWAEKYGLDLDLFRKQ